MDVRNLNKLSYNSIQDLYKVLFDKTKDDEEFQNLRHYTQIKQVMIGNIYEELQDWPIGINELSKLKPETIDDMIISWFNVGLYELNNMKKSFGNNFINTMINEIYERVVQGIKRPLPPAPPTLPVNEAPKIKDDAPKTVNEVLLKHIPSKPVKISPNDNFNYLDKLNKEKVLATDDKLDKLRSDNRKAKFERSLIKPKTAEFKDELNYVNKVFHRMRKQGIKSYNEYKELQHGELQQDLIDEIFETLDKSPSKWFIDFSNMTVKTREAIFDKLKGWLTDKLGEMATSERFLIRFNVNGKYTTKPLTSERFRSLMERFTKKSFVYSAEFKDNSFSFENVSDAVETDTIEWAFFDGIGIEPLKEREGSKLKSGSFFKYINLTDIDLSMCQIFNHLYKDGNEHIQREELNDNCFIYALKQLGMTENDLSIMRQRMFTRYQTPKHLNALCQELHVKVIIHDLEDVNRHSKVRVNKNNFLGDEKADEKRTYEMNLFKEHYFIEARSKYTRDYIKHKYVMKENINDECFDKRFNGRNWFSVDRESRFIGYGDLVKTLFNCGGFRPTTYNEESILNNIDMNKLSIDDVDDLTYDDKACVQLIKPKNEDKEKKRIYSYWYADFEADTGEYSNVNDKHKFEQVHIPYMVCLQSASGCVQKTFIGQDCGLQLLQYLPNDAAVYFHNLGYDIRFSAKYGIKGSIIKGTKTMKAVIEYNDKIIEFRDSLQMLGCKLKKLPKMFGIDDVKKELFPYNYYTIERFNKGIGVINEAGKWEKKKWDKSKYETFINNIKSIKGCLIDDEHFDMIKYAEFYCQQDVRVLRLSFEKFCHDFINEFNLNPKNFISAPSLANEVFNIFVYYPNGNLYKVGGHVRLFMQKAITGGRCMTAFNKKWDVEGKISDYDAVSLYPSAMSRLWTVEGKPKPFHNKNVNKIYSSIPPSLQKYNTSENGIGAYVIEIEIVKVNKHYAFPQITKKTEEGNLNVDEGIDALHPLKMTVDNITLEDLVMNHKIEFKVIRGYVWNGKRDYKIREVITRLFNKRLEYKKAENPLEQLYKLIMNSCYGKTIEKPVMKEWKYVKDEVKFDNKKKIEINPLIDFYNNHYNSIVEDVQLDDSDIHAIRCYSPIDKCFNFSLLGIQVLSMSKRITNEVSCLAYDIGCHVYYTDTDSFHLRTDDIPKLEKCFKEKYGRELRGEMMGQFHSDFPKINDHKEVPISKHSIFLGKKLYVDELIDSTGQIDYMVRGKGLTQECIKHVANQFGGYIYLYKAMYWGRKITFDLTKGSPSFTLNKDMTISTNSEFKRKVKTTYKEGDDSKDFKR